MHKFLFFLYFSEGARGGQGQIESGVARGLTPLATFHIHRYVYFKLINERVNWFQINFRPN